MLLAHIEVVSNDIQPIKIRALTLDGPAFEHIFELPRLIAAGWCESNGPLWTNSVCCKKSDAESRVWLEESILLLRRRP